MAPEGGDGVAGGCRELGGLWVGGRGGTWGLEGVGGDEGLGQIKCGTGRVGAKACVGVWIG